MSGRIRQGSCPHEFTVKWSRQALIELSVSVSHAHTQNKQTKTCGWNTGTDAMEERPTGLEDSMRGYLTLSGSSGMASLRKSCLRCDLNDH